MRGQHSRGCPDVLGANDAAQFAEKLLTKNGRPDRFGGLRPSF